MTAEKICLTEGALYPALHKLLDEGTLITESEWIGNRERKYYLLSELGKQTATSKLEEIKESIRLLVQLFDVKIVSLSC
jgi:DNA-binding PadR family transcriptional regulator